jgi:hypothetical protein
VRAASRRRARMETRAARARSVEPKQQVVSRAMPAPARQMRAYVARGKVRAVRNVSLERREHTKLSQQQIQRKTGKRTFGLAAVGPRSMPSALDALTTAGLMSHHCQRTNHASPGVKDGLPDAVGTRVRQPRDQHKRDACEKTTQNLMSKSTTRSRVV